MKKRLIFTLFLAAFVVMCFAQKPCKVKSVKEIEELTKFEFFPTLPAEVKEKTDAASWGL